jgi:alkanesulfonate monooxygenase SsuD/methylene tetrahydromethanopterin reductase-like flavin-dependent oxidoreductase (luciferase family)
MKVGFALRSTVLGPSSMARIIPLLEGSKADSVWFPSVGHAFDALDMCGISLGESHRLRIGTGVIRYTDYDVARLLARLHTLSEGSGGRFVLGLGTGSGTGRSAIDGLVEVATKLRADYREGQRPPIFFAALKKRMLRVAYLKAEGAILNFCPPRYVQEIVPKDVGTKGFTLACYIKLFFAEKDSIAREMLVDEMKMYNAIPQYHAMFKQIGSSDSIDRLDPELSQGIPDDLLEISSANPDDAEVARILERFSRAGVDLPIIYPYISGDEEYKVAVVERLASIVT